MGYSGQYWMEVGNAVEQDDRGWERQEANLVGCMGPSLRDEGGEEGADEGPGRGEEARLRESSRSLSLVLGASTPFLTTLLILHPLVHQTLLWTETEGGQDAIILFSSPNIYSKDTRKKNDSFLVQIHIRIKNESQVFCWQPLKHYKWILKDGDGNENHISLNLW